MQGLGTEKLRQVTDTVLHDNEKTKYRTVPLAKKHESRLPRKYREMYRTVLPISRIPFTDTTSRKSFTVPFIEIALTPLKMTSMYDDGQMGAQGGSLTRRSSKCLQCRWTRRSTDRRCGYYHVSLLPYSSKESTSLGIRVTCSMLSGPFWFPPILWALSTWTGMCTPSKLLAFCIFRTSIHITQKKTRQLLKTTRINMLPNQCRLMF